MEELEAALDAALTGAKTKAVEVAGAAAPVVDYNSELHQLIINRKLHRALATEKINLTVRVGTAKAANDKLYANVSDDCMNQLMDVHYEF